jgi:hypothetical protein
VTLSPHPKPIPEAALAQAKAALAQADAAARQAESVAKRNVALIQQETANSGGLRRDSNPASASSLKAFRRRART